MSRGLAVAVREVRYAAAALRAPYRSREQIVRCQILGIRQMLAFARADVPHYRDPAYTITVNTLEDVTRLPLLPKAVVRADVTRFHAERPGWVQTDTTSGSTGHIMQVRHDAHAYGYHGATVLRRFLMAGCRPWWSIVHIKPFPRPRRWFQHFGMLPRTVVPAGLPERELKDAVLAIRPRILMGYPVMLRALLRELSPSDLAVLRRRLRVVLSESELLTAEARTLLAEGFGVPVYDEYSAFEVLTIASECRCGAMHVDEDRVLLEVVDEQGRPVPDGTEGSVVVTHFRERAMPLLRYLVGDRVLALPAGCPCGSRFRRMRLLDGRVEDAIQLPDGRRIYFGSFGAITLAMPGIAEFMVRQDETGDVTVGVVHDPLAGLTFDEVAAGIRRMLHDSVGVAVPLRVVPIDHVELTAGGKARMVRSAYRPPARPEGTGVG